MPIFCLPEEFSAYHISDSEDDSIPAYSSIIFQTEIWTFDFFRFCCQIIRYFSVKYTSHLSAPTKKIQIFLWQKKTVFLFFCGTFVCFFFFFLSFFSSFSFFILQTFRIKILPSLVRSVRSVEPFYGLKKRFYGFRTILLFFFFRILVIETDGNDDDTSEKLTFCFIVEHVYYHELEYIWCNFAENSLLVSLYATYAEWKRSNCPTLLITYLRKISLWKISRNLIWEQYPFFVLVMKWIPAAIFTSNNIDF